MSAETYALLVLESPWWTPREDPMRASCLPFFQGLEKFNDRFNIYYATFYDTAGFEAALRYDLSETKEKKQIVYIGAHGARGAIADGRASTILEKAGLYATKAEGVFVSSCNVGEHTINLQTPFFFNDKIRWVWGYTHSVSWLTSTLLEVSLFNAICVAVDFDASDESQVLAVFSEALKQFNPKTHFGIDRLNKAQPLQNCISLQHRGYRKSTIIDLTQKLLVKSWGDINDSK
jgi:hypothetical protein